MRDHNRFVTVEQMCEALFVSGATIRRDLQALEDSHLIRRTRGGAILVEGITSEDPLDFRESQNVMQKQIIAGNACLHIQDGMTLFLDSSSTVYILARNLEPFNSLRIITNGLKTAALLSDFKNLSVMCAGGTVREHSKSLIGQSTVEFVTHLNADIAFMSCRGFSIENGASEASEDEYFIKRQFLKNSKKSILLCDSSKMNIDFLCRLAPLTAFSEVITERKEINDRCRNFILDQA